MANEKDVINEGIRKRALSELDLIDGFLFGEMLSRGKISEWFVKLMVERIIGRKVKEVKFKSDPKIQGPGTDKHGIELDVLIRVYEEEGTDTDGYKPPIFDIEPNAYYIEKDELVRRIRYYQALIDSKVLRSGAGYEELPDSYVIFIMKNDPFGAGLIQYTLETKCREFASLGIDDGRKSIMLYTKGKYDYLPHGKALSNMLMFFESSNKKHAVDKELKALLTEIEKVKSDEDVEVRYVVARDIWNDSIKYESKRLAEQMAERLAEKKAEQMVAEIIMNALKNGKSAEEISDFNGIPLEYVKSVEEKMEGELRSRLMT